MKLSSVRELKQELLTVPRSLVNDVATTRSFRAFSGRQQTADRAMTRIALGVARAKKNEYWLAVRQQQSGPLVNALTEQIEARAKGEVDVRYIGRLAKFASATQPAFYRVKRRPLRIGSSISDVQTNFISAGTLGCFVAGRQAPHYIGMLTNNHVVANENGNAAGSPVVQQGTLDGGKLPQNLVGELGKFIRLRANQRNTFDAAVADVYDDIDFDATQIGNLGNFAGLGDVVSLPDEAIVHKVGRTTGQTKGRVTAFDIDNVEVEYDMGFLRFDNQIEIEGTGNKAFSDSGDSGSLIVDEQLLGIGLLFAGGDEGGSNGKGLTYANPLGSVLDALKVDLEL
jgi:hypothetical protein